MIDAEAMLGQLAAAIGVYVVVADAELTRLLYVSPRWREFIGRGPPAQLDWPELLEPVDAADRPALQAAVAGYLTSRQPFDLECRVLADAGARWVRIQGGALIDAQGSVLGHVGFIRDVTARHEVFEQTAVMEDARRRHAEELERLVEERSARIQLLEQQRVQTEKLAALGQLAAGVAHEINNPLAGIKNAMLLVRDAIPAGHPYGEFADRIDQEVNRIGGIVRKLYELYRPSPAARQPTDLHALVRDVEALADRVLQARQVRFVSDVPPGLPRVALPQGQVTQILEQLVRNAVEASPPGGAIMVRAGVVTDGVRFEVIDRGPGIAADVLPLIYDPFFTTKAGDAAQHHGLGLGLSVTQSVVHALGGKLQATSRPGEGTTFVVALPLIR